MAEQQQCPRCGTALGSRTEFIGGLFWLCESGGTVGHTIDRCAEVLAARVRELEQQVTQLEGRACLVCGLPNNSTCPMRNDEVNPCTFDPSPIDAARRFLKENADLRQQIVSLEQNRRYNAERADKAERSRDEPDKQSVTRQSCNRHSDCEAARRKAVAEGRNPYTICCHDECCPDCFGD